jgi:hypothetical protein
MVIPITTNRHGLHRAHQHHQHHQKNRMKRHHHRHHNSQTQFRQSYLLIRWLPHLRHLLKTGVSRYHFYRSDQIHQLSFLLMNKIRYDHHHHPAKV